MNFLAGSEMLAYELELHDFLFGTIKLDDLIQFFPNLIDEHVLPLSFNYIGRETR